MAEFAEIVQKELRLEQNFGHRFYLLIRMATSLDVELLHRMKGRVPYQSVQLQSYLAGKSKTSERLKVSSFQKLVVEGHTNDNSEGTTLFVSTQK